MHNQLFPIHLTGAWTACQQALQCTDKVSSWLYDKSSLTQKLEGLCKKFQVKIRQQKMLSSASPALSGVFSGDSSVLVREVFLYCDGIPVVFAQTEIPASSLIEQSAQLAEIGTKSLGKVLFQDATMQRGDIEVAQFRDLAQFAPLAQDTQQSFKQPLWARRSLFHVHHKPLLVSELFLPASGIYLP